MSNKTQLQTNNTKLDTLIARVNSAKDVAASLPDAGSSGGSVEAWTGTICQTTGLLGDSGSTALYYTDETVTGRIYESMSAKFDISITILANTYIYIPTYKSSFSLENVLNVTSQIDLDNYRCLVLLPTSNNFSITLS